METPSHSQSPHLEFPAARGKKRPRSSSSPPESARKRQSLLPEPSPPLISPEPTQLQLPPISPEHTQLRSNWHCSNCGRPCWGCSSTLEVPPDIANLDEEDEDIDRLRMPSAPQTPSQSAYSTQSGATQNTCSITSNKKRKQYADNGQVYVGPKDKDFDTAILAPLGVIFSHSSARLKPIDTFGLQPLAPKSRVIVQKETEELAEIVEDFKEFKAQKYDEHTLTTIYHDSIVLRDKYFRMALRGEDQSEPISVRRDKWKPKKEKEGPLIPSTKYVYDWDIEPDTTYAVSARIFDMQHRRELRMKDCEHLIAQNAAVCPYLTIEYKCSEKTGKSSDATNQNTAASVLWLHQRKQIRQELGLSLADLKHFSITFVDSNFTIWEARFEDGLYDLRELVHGDLTIMYDLKLYIEWSNAIHTWGLGPSASSFKQDIVTLLDRRHNQSFLTPPSMRSSADTVPGSIVVQPEGKDDDRGIPGEEVMSNSKSS